MLDLAHQAEVAGVEAASDLGLLDHRVVLQENADRAQRQPDEVRDDERGAQRPEPDEDVALAVGAEVEDGRQHQRDDPAVGAECPQQGFGVYGERPDLPGHRGNVLAWEDDVGEVEDDEDRHQHRQEHLEPAQLHVGEREHHQREADHRQVEFRAFDEQRNQRTDQIDHQPGRRMHAVHRRGGWDIAHDRLLHGRFGAGWCGDQPDGRRADGDGCHVLGSLVRCGLVDRMSLLRRGLGGSGPDALHERLALQHDRRDELQHHGAQYPRGDRVAEEPADEGDGEGARGDQAEAEQYEAAPGGTDEIGHDDAEDGEDHPVTPGLQARIGLEEPEGNAADHGLGEVAGNVGE
ncbi:hypothetical protein SDC9_131428 [bioreactor metagenome]|uniref:Uncharacterized protein n=1 Tax=bioreactor metagenome TaxID=1076179 RepID=A0A645D575_9ZZZZ